MLPSTNLSLLIRSSIQATFLRHGHQMSTKNKCVGPKPKHRGIKRQENESVHAGDILVTQRAIRIHPGMNVRIVRFNSLQAACAGKIKFTSEKFNPNFDNPIVMRSYANREGQTIYKKYINVIPPKEHIRFRLVDVV